MTTPGAVNATQLLSLDQALRYAVLQSWDELMPQSSDGSIQIEYQNAADSELQYLKLWKSTELGRWVLVAEFWEKPMWRNPAGLRMGSNISNPQARCGSWSLCWNIKRISLPSPEPRECCRSSLQRPKNGQRRWRGAMWPADSSESLPWFL